MVRDDSAVLLALLLIAALHAAAAAMSRPLFQVSDEVNYLASVQRIALAEAPSSLHACVSPPDGTRPAEMPTGGKWLFHRIGSAGLVAFCHLGAGPLAPLWLRVAFGLSLVVVTWAGWQTARVLYPGTWIPPLVGLLLATQPVLAKYAGAVTPDSLANMFAALAVMAGVGWARRGPGVAALGGMVVFTALAISAKDAALGLVPVTALLVGTPLMRAGVLRRPAAVMVTCVGLLLVAATGTLARTAYQISPGLDLARGAPLEFGRAVLADLIPRVVPMVMSAWTALGVFGGSDLASPPVLAVWVAGLGALAAGGILRRPLVDDPVHRLTIACLWASLAVFLIQPSVRQVLLRTADLHQGRWLFPAAVPSAVLMAAGISRGLGRRAPRAWPLLVVGSVTMLCLSVNAVVSWHVADASWQLDRQHLYLYSTGGLAIDGERVEQMVRGAWPAARTLVIALLGGIVVCGGALLRLPPATD